MADDFAYNVVHVMVVDDLIGENVPINTVAANPISVEIEMNIKEKFVPIQRGVGALLQTIHEFLNKGIELERASRVAVLLSQSGLNNNNSIFQQLFKDCVSAQKDDGGWLGVVDTLWCTSFLEAYDKESDVINNALSWLIEQRHEEGSWGKNKRDIGRITVTGQMLYFIPQLVSKSSLNWLEKKWKEELDLDPKLTYKGAFTLMAFNRNNYQPTDSQIISKTIEWLVAQQNEDLGWGPWKGHPVESDPWCTGITIVGLLQYPNKVPKKVILDGLEWLKIKQLPNGLWPYHYIEQGSSWALCALAMGYNFLEGRKID